MWVRKEGDKEVWPRRQGKTAVAGGDRGGEEGSVHQELGYSGGASPLVLELN